MNLDQEFIYQMDALMDVSRAQFVGAEAAGDKKKQNYLRGIYRGIQMAREAYFTCWKIEELDSIQPSHVSFVSGGVASKPPSSDPEDLP